MVRKTKAKANRKNKATDKQAAELSVDCTLQPANDNLSTHHPHDKFVKISFENKAIAIAFFDAHLKDKKLSKKDLENLGNCATEHQRPFDSALFSDVVYRGVIKNQVYYVTVEHQSSADNTMLLRFLEYTVALIKKEVGQGKGSLENKMPVIIPICLYSGKNLNYKPLTSTDSCFLNNRHAGRSNLKYGFKLVDLTNMADEEIAQHGHAAILEWFLKDAFGNSEDFCERAEKHLVHERYTELNTDNFREFKVALYEYILSIVDKTPRELISSLVRIVPHEEKLMLTAADRLRQEGIEEGIQKGRQKGRQDERLAIAKDMLAGGADRKFVKKFTKLSDEMLDHLSTDGSETGSPLQVLESVSNPALLAQSVSSSTVEQVGEEVMDNASSSIERNQAMARLKNLVVGHND